MHAAVVGHMLAQKLHADVHKLNCVERTSPKLRTFRRVSRSAFKFVQHLYRGIIRAGFDLINIRRMPAERSVELFPDLLARHERLAAAALFAGAAEEYDSAAAAAVLKVFFHRESRRKRAHAEQVMAAAVAVSVLNDGVFFARSGFLRKAGERVKFAEDTDIRSAAAKRAAERGVYAAELFAHIEAVLAQDAAVKRRGLILLERKLGVLPYLICCFFVEVRHRLD